MSSYDLSSWITIALGTVVPWLLIIVFFKVLSGRRNSFPLRRRKAQILVLGDLGRSPRMQYHALSLAKNGFDVDLIGYHESTPHPDVVGSSKIHIINIPTTPKVLTTGDRRLFILLGPAKVLFQIAALIYILFFRTEPAGWLLVQNPPSIPTLAIAQAFCLLRQTRLIIDWHNFGYSILAMKLGHKHPFVRAARAYEYICSQSAYAHFCVSDAMAKSVQRLQGFAARLVTLYDRPPSIFRVLNGNERALCLEKLGRELSLSGGEIKGLKSREIKLLVSSTSWTPDEDFSILLEGLKRYSNHGKQGSQQAKILTIITGKGPQKSDFENQVRLLEAAGMLEGVQIKTAFFDELEDYAKLLGSADLGISLHTSSSGVDLPMKVVDMFGAGLPVIGWDNYESWPELVTQGRNGAGFRDLPSLTSLLLELFGNDDSKLGQLKKGALEESQYRWDDEWEKRAKGILGN